MALLKKFVLVRGCFLVVVLCVSSCDRGLEADAEEMGIAGTVFFEGDWPEGVEEVAVAVYRDLPQEPSDLLGLSGADQGVVLNSKSYDYFIPLDRGGVYRWIIVAWRRPDAFWDFTSLLGCYQTEGDLHPGAVEVAFGEVVDGVDFIVDLNFITSPPDLRSNTCTSVLPQEILDAATGS